MLRNPLAFLIGVSFSVEVRVELFGVEGCNYTRLMVDTIRESEEPSCDSYTNDLFFACSGEYPYKTCMDVLFGCVSGGYVETKEGEEYKSAKYTCQGPSPTCDDNRKNGNEEGVDCGGDCNPCPSNCKDYVCESSWSLVENPETKKCAGNPCDRNDLGTCCDRNALCSELSGECNSSYVLISDANSTYCAGIECRLSDHRLCCAHVSSCENFHLCDNATEYLKEDADHLLCNADFCDESDISKCCAKKARCSSWQCNIHGGYTNIDNDENVYCERDPCDEDDSNTCCTEREGFVSAGGSGLSDEAIAIIVVAAMGTIFVTAGLAWCELKLSKGSGLEEPHDETELLKNCEAQKVEDSEQLKN